MLDRVIEIINNRGYEAKVQTTCKNGIEKTAISIISKKSNMSPVIYIDSVNDRTAEEIARVAMRLLFFLEENMGRKTNEYKKL